MALVCRCFHDITLPFVTVTVINSDCMHFFLRLSAHNTLKRRIVVLHQYSIIIQAMYMLFKRKKEKGAEYTYVTITTTFLQPRSVNAFPTSLFGRITSTQCSVTSLFNLEYCCLGTFSHVQIPISLRKGFHFGREAKLS